MNLQPRTLNLFWRHTDAAVDPPVIFLPGWGFGGRIVELVRPALSWICPEGPVDPDSMEEELLALLEQKGFGRIRLAGWSMGAHLALDFARAHPDRVEKLYLLAMRKEWPELELDKIRQEFSRDPAGFLSGFYRKCFLGERRYYDRFQAGLEPEMLASPPVAVLHRGLDYLARARTAAVPVSARLVHGRRDVIVPLAEQAVVPGAETEILAHAGHLVFLDPGFSLARKARKERIRHLFSQAAPTYDRHASIQKEAAGLLAGRLPAFGIDTILELGCGTGAYSSYLADRYPRASMLVLDFSAAMLAAAESRLGRQAGIRFHCEDGEEFLARGAEPFDLITSNATLQWFADLEPALGHISRRLNPSGVFLASLFGPETLEELRQGLSLVLEHEFVLPSGRFCSAGSIRGLLSQHFSAATLEEVRLSRHYQSLRELLNHIRNTGTAGWREAPPPVLTRERLKRLDNWFGGKFGGYRLTYQLFLVRGER